MKYFKLFRSFTAVVLLLSVLSGLVVGAFATEGEIDESLSGESDVYATSSLGTDNVPLSEEKAATKDSLNGKDYLLLHFKVGSYERDIGWHATTTHTTKSATRHTHNWGRVGFYAKGASSAIATPLDNVNRINPEGYVMKSGDIVQVRFHMKEVASEGISNGNTATTQGQVTVRASGTNYTVAGNTVLKKQFANRYI